LHYTPDALLGELVRSRPFQCLALFYGLILILACRQPEPDRGDHDGAEIGSRLPNVLQQARLRNAPVGVKAPLGGWVIYVFSPAGCLQCEESSRRIEALARALPPDWALLSIATEEEGLPSFVERMGVTVPVLTQVPKSTLARYRLTSTPRTYILDKDWELLDVLDGPVQGQVAEKLAARFAVSLEPLAQERPKQPARSRLCLDKQRYEYSRGAKADALGMRVQCEAGGVWAPAH
jgi:hypothetical protein